MAVSRACCRLQQHDSHHGGIFSPASGNITTYTNLLIGCINLFVGFTTV
jgi:hypothetical protein